MTYELQGFDKITISDEIFYIAPKALSKFKYLYEYDEKAYARNSNQLTTEQLNEYEMALTLPKNSSEFYIRINDPLLVWKCDGTRKGYFIINGNSRVQTINYLLHCKSNLEITPIPYRLIVGDLDTGMIDRLQYDSNDRTRKNPAIKKLQRIYSFLDNAIKGGMKESQARSYVATYFGVSKQSISNSTAIFEKSASEFVTELLQENRITVDAVITANQASDKLLVPVDTILSEVIASTKKLSVGARDIKKWREDYIKNNANKKEVIIEEMSESPPENTEPTDSTPEANIGEDKFTSINEPEVETTEKTEKTETTQPSNTAAIDKIMTADIKKTKLLLLMSAQMLDHPMTDESLAEISILSKELLKKLLETVPTPQSFLDKITNNL